MCICIYLKRLFAIRTSDYEIGLISFEIDI